MYQIALIVHTLYVYPYIQFQYVSQEFLCVSDEKVHGSDAGQGTDYPGDSEVVVDSLDDHL